MLPRQLAARIAVATPSVAAAAAAAAVAAAVGHMSGICQAYVGGSIHCCGCGGLRVGQYRMWIPHRTVYSPV